MAWPIPDGVTGGAGRLLRSVGEVLIHAKACSSMPSLPVASLSHWGGGESQQAETYGTCSLMSTPVPSSIFLSFMRGVIDG